MENKRIVLTGGGTTGHVSVNLGLIPILKDNGFEIHYLGSKTGIERDLISQFPYVKYHAITTGKLRRYISFQNFLDIFKVLFGIIQSIFKIFKIKPSVVFSKGGFVSVPVIIGAWFNRVPSISHESDLTPGLANKLIQPFVKIIYTTFPETSKYIKSGKGEFLGPVIRNDLIGGNAKIAKEQMNINNDKPVLLVMGGSLGANFINQTIRDNLDILLEKFNIIHSVGKDGLDNSINKKGYYQFEYINENLKDILALSDIVLSRAGSNAIFEFLYYRIPMLLVPLPRSQSRGDQYDNAESFKEQGFAEVYDEENSNNEDLIQKLFNLYEHRDKYIESMGEFEFKDNLLKIFNKLNEIKK